MINLIGLTHERIALTHYRIAYTPDPIRLILNSMRKDSKKNRVVGTVSAPHLKTTV